MHGATIKIIRASMLFTRTYIACLFIAHYVEDVFRVLLFDVVHSLKFITRHFENWILRWKWERRIINWMVL